MDPATLSIGVAAINIARRVAGPVLAALSQTPLSDRQRKILAEATGYLAEAMLEHAATGGTSPATENKIKSARAIIANIEAIGARNVEDTLRSAIIGALADLPRAVR